MKDARWCCINTVRDSHKTRRDYEQKTPFQKEDKVAWLKHKRGGVSKLSVLTDLYNKCV